VSRKPATVSAHRLRALDGLRGVAAVVVVIHHSLLAVPVFAAPYYNLRPVTGTGSFAWLMTHTPLHLVWAGTEAVYVFFVLSGLVLTLPMLREQPDPWRVYYARRLIRLYLPVLAAVAFGLLMVTVVARPDTAGLSRWLQERPATVTPVGTLRDTTLVFGVSRLISPLWSLQWEVLFSLALPLYVLVAVRFRRLLAVKVVGILSLVTVGALAGAGFLLYLPMFAAGVLLAVNFDRLRTRTARLRDSTWWALTIAAALLCSGYWMLLAVDPGKRALALTQPLILLAAAALVVIATAWSRARRLFESRPIQWLGAISFSLYLVHEPIVIASGFLFGPDLGGAVLPVALPASLLVGWLFFRYVERPAHKFARRMGTRFAR
jgi:peptidoglycan/LPS O-acetylase OafA/YrhL